MIYAQTDPVSGKVTLLYEIDSGPSLPGSIDITNIDPQPNLGWTTPDDGVTWEPPPPDDMLGAQGKGRVVVQELAATIAAQLAQAETDAAFLETWETEQGLTFDVVACLQRSQAGWVTLLQGLAALVNSLWAELTLTTPAVAYPPVPLVGTASASSSASASL